MEGVFVGSRKFYHEYHSEERCLVSVKVQLVLILLNVQIMVELTVNLIIILRNVSVKAVIQIAKQVVYLSNHNLSAVRDAKQAVHVTQANAQSLMVIKTVYQMMVKQLVSARPGSLTPITDA